MDIKMEDVGGKGPESQEVPSGPVEAPSIPTLDGWIDNLMNCKQLAENDVQRLCDKVRTTTKCSSGAFPASSFVSLTDRGNS